jgi:hypothetical protein
MKKTLLFLFLFPCFLAAQSWSPLNSSEAFNFRLDNDPVLTSTLRADSYTFSSGDTIFNYNTIVCDSCITIVGGPNACDSCYGLTTKEQFLGKQLIKMQNGWCNFRNPGSQAIDLHATLLQTWLFDTTANVTAVVVANGMSTVLGFPDSVKTLLLSSGDTVMFSKNYGIVQWPNGYGQNSYYRLKGIHGRDIGELVPRMKDYFDFNIGDMFEYQGKATHGMNPVMQDFIRKYTITGKTISGDSLIYTVSGIYYSQDYHLSLPSPGSYFLYVHQPFTATYTYVDSTGHFGNHFNNMLLDSGERVNAPPGWGDCCFPSSFVYSWLSNSAQLFKDSLGLDGILFGSMLDSTTCFTPTVVSDTTLFYGSDTLNPFYGFGNYASNMQRAVYKKGLGQVYSNYTTFFEESFLDRLTAYQVNGDTVGTFTTDSWLMGIENGLAIQTFSLYPNPAADEVTIILPQNGTAEVTLIDPLGRTVKSFGKMSGQNNLSIADITNGVYFLRVVNGNDNSQQKLIIAH